MAKQTSLIVTGTVAALEVSVGFIPDRIEVLNLSSRAVLEYNRFAAEIAGQLGGQTISAAGARTLIPTKAAGVTLPDHLDELKGFTLGAAAACAVNVTDGQLLVTAYQEDYVESIDHTPRFKDTTESTGGLFEAAELEPVPLSN